MTFWLVLTVNSVTFGGLLFLLSAGFSLIFGLMRIPNLTHGSLFMLGAYIGATFVIGLLGVKLNFWLAAILATLAVALSRRAGRTLAAAPAARRPAGAGAGDARPVLHGRRFLPDGVGRRPALGARRRTASAALRGSASAFSRSTGWRSSPSPSSFAIALWLLLDRTRLGAMIRAGVDDPDMARVVGIRVSQLFTIVFALGAGLAAFAGIIGGPILSVYPGLDQDMLPLALVVVILGGTGSLLGSFVGSIVVGFIYNFGQALLPELAYFVLFLPMLLVLLLRPQGLFGRHVP